MYAVAVGTQFPDLVDKPLAWSIPLLPAGRSLAHSLLTLAMLSAIVWRYAPHPDQRDLLIAFDVGYVSHLVADGVYPVAAGDFAAIRYLLWPLVPVAEEHAYAGILAFFQQLSVTPIVAGESALFACAIICWWRDGFPGLLDVVYAPDDVAGPRQRNS